MINYYITEDGFLNEINESRDGCWVSVTNPNKNELMDISKQYNIDAEDLISSLDEDERSRIEIDDEYTMILVKIPTIEKYNNKELYNTVPLSIIMSGESVITICSEPTLILKQFEEGKVRGFNTFMKSRFVLQILYRTSSLYLRYLRIIDKKSEEVESKLHKSTQNRELIELLKLEKSLVYFTTALRANESVLEKLLRNNDIIKKYPEDSELLDDVIVENKQAIEMANIYSGILSGMMDAFASVISNNLNIVMKVLAIITIVMSIPTMIFSAYGMNVLSSGMPFANSPYGFLTIVMLSIILSLVVTIILIKMKMFK